MPDQSPVDFGDDQLLTPEDLAKLLCRSVQTVKVDARRNPKALPPRVRLPGSNRLRWSRKTTVAWLRQLEDAA